MKIKIAIATDDGKDLTEEHFGSAKKYLIYELDLENKELKFLEESINLTPEERKHGDPEKAKAVADVLGNVKVLINLVFGPNITRMRKKFIPVVSRIKEINKLLEKLKLKTEEIKENLNKKEKDIIYIKEE